MLKRGIALLLVAFALSWTNVRAQNVSTFAYGETVSGIFEPGGTQTQTWTFDLDAREYFEVRLQRIGGQFSPMMQVIAPDGSTVSPDETRTTPDYQQWRFTDVYNAGTYQVQVSGEVAPDSVVNPSEYSLTLLYLGRHSAGPDAELTPLPTLGTSPAPDFRDGNGTTNTDLGITVYGGTVTQPDARAERNRFIIQGNNGRSIDLDNANPINRSVTAIGFVGDSVGFATENTLFVVNEDIAAFEVVQGIFNFTLASGQTFQTDFYNTDTVQVVDGLVAMRLTSGQRVLLSGETFDIQRRGGLNGQGPNIEPALEFLLPNEDYIYTDFVGWDTLAYLNLDGRRQTRAVYGNDYRLITDINRLELFQRGFIPEDDAAEGVDTSYTDALIDLPDSNVTLNIQPDGMGDVEVANNQLLVRPLDGRMITEPLENVNRLLIENAAARVERVDETYRLSLPDGTEVETPAEVQTNSQLLPDAENFAPQQLNNLGRTIFDYHPGFQLDQMLMPVNRANGNFFYPVEEISVPGHTLQLSWARHYNSLSPETLVPDYVLNAPVTYLPAQLGQGWRHTYQIDLNIRTAPLGTVMVTLPDGSRHQFRNSENAPNRFLSNSLLSWTVERTNGLTGTWQATTTEGRIYEFDRAGRLQRIGNAQGHYLLLSPAPRSAVAEVNAAGGFFVTEPYGRRLEIYTDENNNIIRVRDTQERDIIYTYSADGVYLEGVDYIDPAQQATYTYENGKLSTAQDPRSPYHHDMTVRYSPEGQVVEIVKNPESNNAPSQTTRFDYTTEPQVLIESTEINGELRESRWTRNNQNEIVRYDTPEAGWTYRYEFDPQTRRLAELIQPDNTRIGMRMNERGYLTEFRPPRYRSTPYAFTYEEREDGQLQVTEILHPPVGGVQPWERFTYDENGRLTEHRRLVQSGREPVEQVTQYTYDEMGRITRKTELPQGDGSDRTPRVTAYSYDNFGYLSRVSVGTAEDINQDTSQRVTTYQHDAVGRLLSVANGRGTETAIVWNDERNLITQLRTAISNESNVVVNYQYDDLGNVTQIQDRGATVDYQYNDLRQVTAITDAANLVTNYTYDEAGNILSVTLPDDDASVFQYRYDGLDRLRQVTSPNGLRTRYDYTLPEDGSLTLLDVTDPTNDRVRYTLDALGRVIVVEKTSNTGFNVYQYNLEYNAQGNLTQVQEAHVPGGRTLNIDYDLTGKPLSTTINQTTTAFTYDAFGYLQTVTNPAENTITYERDLFGNATRVIRPDATEESFFYDENGNLTQHADPLDQVTRYSYDPLDRLTSVERPDGTRIDYEYDERGNLIRRTDPRGNELLAEYDALNRLIRTQDSAGNVTSYEYDNLGRLLVANQPGGRNQRYAYDREGNVVAVTPPSNAELLYGYDGLGRVTSVTNSLGYSTLYSYNAINRLSGIVDALGNERTYRWSSSGRMREYLTPDGRTYEYTYDDLGRLGRIIDRALPANAIDTFFEYGPTGLINVLEYATSNNRRTSTATRHSYTYNELGNIVSYTPPAADAAWQLEYDAAQQLIAATDPVGNRTEYTYDIAGNVEQVRRDVGQPEETVTEYEYDAAGNVTRRVAPDGVISEFVYDERNQLIAHTVGANSDDARTTRYTYNAAGDLTSVIDYADHETRYVSDSLGRLLQIERQLTPDEGETQAIRHVYEYDDAGNLTRIRFPDGTDVNMTYNALNDRVRYVDATSSVWAYSYDAVGNMQQVNDPLGSAVQYTYDAADRLREILYPTGNSVGVRYDRNNNPNVRAVDISPNQEEDMNTRERIIYQLDPAGQLSEIRHGASEQNVFTFERDNNGNVVQRQSANGQTITYTYDGHQRLISTSTPSNTTRYTYDAADRLVQVTGNEGTYTYTYDAFGNVQTMTTPDYTASYTYDANGNVLTRDLGDFGQYAYEYDSLERPVRVSKNDDGINITYTDNGWVQQIQRDNGSQTQYGHDDNGRITQLIHFNSEGMPIDRFNYRYDAVGNVNRAQRNAPDLWTVIYSYDANHRLIGERWLNSTNETLYSLSLRYDNAGNRIEKTTRRSFEEPVRVRYTYNNQNQLESETRNFVPPAEEQILSIPRAITISLAGLPFLVLLLLWRRKRNWLPVSTLLVLFILPLTVYAQPADVDPDVLNYEYDRNGNVTRITYPEDNQLNFEYDAHNRLTGVRGTDIDGEAVDVRLTYNAFSQLRTINNGDQNYQLIYEGDTLIAMRETTTGYLETYFTPLGDDIARVDANGESTWLLRDVFQNVRRYMGQDGTLLADGRLGYSFTAFGEFITPYGADQAYTFTDAGDLATADYTGERFTQSARPQPLYRGELYEPQVGAYMMGVRAYEPQTGRFIQRDPVRHDPQGTLYTYAYNRPNAYTDPTGLTAETAIRNLDAIDVPSQVLPDPKPESILPDFPALQAVDALQAQEMHRPLRIMQQVVHHTNTVTAVLDPTLCDFHMLQAKPVDSLTRETLAASSQQIVNQYDTGSGWFPLRSPGNTQTSPQQMAQQARYQLEFTRTAGQLWRNRPCEAYISLPSLPDLDPLSGTAHYEALPPILQEVNLYPSLVTYADTLTDEQTIVAPSIPVPQVATQNITPVIDFPRPGFFGDLYTETRDFYEQTLTVSQPVPDATTWREELRTINISPPVNRIVR